jgi:hypothetical protein
MRASTEVRLKCPRKLDTLKMLEKHMVILGYRNGRVPLTTGNVAIDWDARSSDALSALIFHDGISS